MQRKIKNKTIPGSALSVLLLGFVSQVGQVLILREFLMAFQGNELTIGIILAAWMVWVAAGSFIGGFVSDRFPNPEVLFKFSAAGIVVFLPATILVIRTLRGFFDIIPGAYLSLYDILLSCFIVAAPVCILLGVQFVVLAKIRRKKKGVNDTSGAGFTYMGEAAGNMIGGVLFTFLMVHYLTPLQSAFLAGTLMAGAAFIMSRRMLLLLPLFAAGFFLLRSVDEWGYALQWNNFAPNHRLVEVRNSKHGTVSVAELHGQYSFFQSGHLVFSTAGPDKILSDLEEQDAFLFTHLSMMQHQNPVRVLLVGGGLRGILSQLALYPVERIDYLELDRVLTDAALPYVSRSTFDTLQREDVNLIHADGRLFIKTLRNSYDMVIVDFPDPATAVLNRFYTEEFFSEISRVLNPGGVLVTGVVSTPDLRGRAIANRNTAIYHTLKSVFPQVLAAGERFMFFIASDEKGEITVDASELSERFSSRGIRTKGFSGAYFYSFLQDSQIRRVNWVLRNHGRSPDAHIEGPRPGPVMPPTLEKQIEEEKRLPSVSERFFINSDFRPIGYYYTLMFWEQLTRAGKTQTFKLLQEVNFNRFLPFTLLPFLILILMRIYPKREDSEAPVRFSVLFAVFTTGFSTMMLQIALIFSFQSIYGFVYETVGLIIALFMFGLSFGTYISNRYIKDKSNLSTLASLQLLIAILAGLLAFLLPEAGGMRYPGAVFILFALFTFTAGLVNGMDFPLAAECLLITGTSAEKSAGYVYGIELMGACIGALAASVFIAPVMGIATCCFLAMFAGVAAFLLILIVRVIWQKKNLKDAIL